MTSKHGWVPCDMPSKLTSDGLGLSIVNGMNVVGSQDQVLWNSILYLYCSVRRNQACLPFNQQVTGWYYDSGTGDYYERGIVISDEWKELLRLHVGGRISKGFDIKVLILATAWNTSSGFDGDTPTIRCDIDGVSDSVAITPIEGSDLLDDPYFKLDTGRTMWQHQHPTWYELTIPGFSIEPKSSILTLSCRSISLPTNITIWAVSAYQECDSSVPAWISMEESGQLMSTDDMPYNTALLHRLIDNARAVWGNRLPRNNIVNHWFRTWNKEGKDVAYYYYTDDGREYDLGWYSVVKREGFDEITVRIWAGAVSANLTVNVQLYDVASSAVIDTQTAVVASGSHDWYTITFSSLSTDETEYQICIDCDAQTGTIDIPIVMAVEAVGSAVSHTMTSAWDVRGGSSVSSASVDAARTMLGHLWNRGASILVCDYRWTQNQLHNITDYDAYIAANKHLTEWGPMFDETRLCCGNSTDKDATVLHTHTAGVEPPLIRSIMYPSYFPTRATEIFSNIGYTTSPDTRGSGLYLSVGDSADETTTSYYKVPRDANSNNNLISIFQSEYMTLRYFYVYPDVDWYDLVTSAGGESYPNQFFMFGITGDTDNVEYIKPSFVSVYESVFSGY